MDVTNGASADGESTVPPLADLRVVDVATIYAGPMIGTLLADFGADVVKVEHPRGDGLRHWEWRKDGESLWWAVVGRNKRAITLALSDPRGAEILRRLLAEADVLIENFRPGTLERWGLGPDELHAVNPRLVIVRVSGFGQTGPYRLRPGFGTLAESLSGFAHTNGPADGPPMLPQWPLADGVAALAGAFAAMVAVRHAAQSGQGQVVDLSIYEPLFWVLGAQATAYDQLGKVPGRQGNSTDFNVPRNCFRSRDGRWIALSGATTATAGRIMRAVGRSDLAEQPWFDDIAGRLEHRDEIDKAIASWVAEHTSEEALAVFRAADAAVGPVCSIEDIVHDPHFLERQSVTRVDHPTLGSLLMQGLIARLTGTPGHIRNPGPRLGEHTEQVLGAELGLGPEVLAELVRDHVIAPPDSPPHQSSEDAQ